MPDDLLRRLNMAHVRPGSMPAMPSVPADLPARPLAGPTREIPLSRARVPDGGFPKPQFAPVGPSRTNVGFARPLPLAGESPTPAPRTYTPTRPGALPSFMQPPRPATAPGSRAGDWFSGRVQAEAARPPAAAEPPLSSLEQHFLNNMGPHEPPAPAAAAARLQPGPSVIPPVTSDPALAHVAKQTAYGLHLDSPAAVADAARLTIPPPGPSASSLELAAMDQAFSPHGVGLPGGAGPMLRGMAGRVGSGLGQAALVNEVGGHFANSLAEAFYPTSGHPGLGAALDGSPRFLGLGAQPDANERNFNDMVKAEGLSNRRPMPTIAGAMGFDAGGGEVGNARYHGPDVNVPDTLAGRISGWIGGPQVGSPLNRHRPAGQQVGPAPVRALADGAGPIAALMSAFGVGAQPPAGPARPWVDSLPPVGPAPPGLTLAPNDIAALNAHFDPRRLGYRPGP